MRTAYHLDARDRGRELPKYYTADFRADGRAWRWHAYVRNRADDALLAEQAGAMPTEAEAREQAERWAIGQISGATPSEPAPPAAETPTDDGGSREIIIDDRSGRSVFGRLELFYKPLYREWRFNVRVVDRNSSEVIDIVSSRKGFGTIADATRAGEAAAARRLHEIEADRRSRG